MNNQPAVRCKNIKKSYGSNETRIDALRGVNLDVKSGELTLLVGPSGSGKSTLLSIITNILTPDEGELYLLGQDIKSMSPEEKAKFSRENLGIVFQSLFLIPTLTVAENVSLPLLLAGMAPEQAEQKSVEVLGRLGIANRAGTSPANLSKGQQQRVAIARAIANDSKIMVCDEPTSSLDHMAGQEVMAILKNLAENDSRAVLVVTHDHRIFSFADRIITMDDGLITEGKP